MMHRLIGLIALLAIFSTTAQAATKEELVKKYQNDPKVSAEMKRAIDAGVVIAGMCPLHAYAAAGNSTSYMVNKDKKKWGASASSQTIIESQCSKPDDSVIELAFKNKTQFKSEEPTSFRVRFVKGKAVLIDQKKFMED
jgi:hypothetical protein